MTTSDKRLRELAAELVLAMMASASTDNISAKHWWDRAQSALQTGATRQTLDGMVSAMARKLQIEALRERSASSICSITDEIGDDFERFRRYCERNAHMAVARARVERGRQKEEAGIIREHTRPVEAQLANALEREKAASMEADRLRNRVAELEGDVTALKRHIEEGKA